MNSTYVEMNSPRSFGAVKSSRSQGAVCSRHSTPWGGNNRIRIMRDMLANEDDKFFPPPPTPPCPQSHPYRSSLRLTRPAEPQSEEGCSGKDACCLITRYLRLALSCVNPPRWVVIQDVTRKPGISEKYFSSGMPTPRLTRRVFAMIPTV